MSRGGEGRQQGRPREQFGAGAVLGGFGRPHGEL